MSVENLSIDLNAELNQLRSFRDSHREQFDAMRERNERHGRVGSWFKTGRERIETQKQLIAAIKEAVGNFTGGDFGASIYRQIVVSGAAPVSSMQSTAHQLAGAWLLSNFGPAIVKAAEADLKNQENEYSLFLKDEAGTLKELHLI